MCIINENAHVAKTQIFVSPNHNNTEQITVYANQVMTESSNNVMILPVPNPNSVKFIDLSNYKNIFKDLEESYKEHTYSATNSLPMKLSRSFLPTIDIGSYRITLVPHISQIDNINPTEFAKVRPFIKSILQKHYPNFGFIICKLRPGKETDYHPLAYSHSIHNNKLFVPTRHQHNHSHEPTNNNEIFSWKNGPQTDYWLDGTPKNKNEFNRQNITYTNGEVVDIDNLSNESEEFFSDWDHNIYSFNTTKAAGNCRLLVNKCFLNTNKINNFSFGNLKSMNKMEITGQNQNMDYIFSLA